MELHQGENSTVKWRKDRRSKNVQDHRRSAGSGKRKAAIGGMGGIIVTVIFVLLNGGGAQDVLQQLLQGGGQGQTQSAQLRPLTAEEIELGELVKTVLAYTEDVWDEVYPALAQHHLGRRERYQHPQLILFAGQYPSGCGQADAAMGPFYCPADQQVYIDLEFYGQLARRFGAPGDFAQAYVIAHEVAHHIQHLLGITTRVHQEKQRISKAAYNQLSVRLELQADYFAGVWARQAEERFKILDSNDLEEGLRAASAIGDDTIQKKARGRVVPESFTHGTSAQRVRWFRRGFDTGDPTRYDPFKVRYEDL